MLVRNLKYWCHFNEAIVLAVVTGTITKSMYGACIVCDFWTELADTMVS